MYEWEVGTEIKKVFDAFMETMESKGMLQEFDWACEETDCQITFETETTCSYERCILEIDWNGNVKVQGDAESFNDFFGLARGVDKGHFTPEQIQSALNKFSDSWQEALNK